MNMPATEAPRRVTVSRPLSRVVTPGKDPTPMASTYPAPITEPCRTSQTRWTGPSSR